MHEKPSPARKKAIHTLAKKRGISEKKAEQIESVAIAYRKAGRSRKKK